MFERALVVNEVIVMYDRNTSATVGWRRGLSTLWEIECQDWVKIYMRPCCKLARLNLNKKGPWTQLPHSLSISSNPNRLIRYDLAIDHLTYHLSVLLHSYVLLPPPVFTTCLLPRNIPSEYGFFCRPHTSTHFFFFLGSVSSSPAVPVTSVSILFFSREPTDQKCGRLSRRACPSRNTAIQGRQHRQFSQLIPQSIFTTRRVSAKFSPARCIRDRERVDCH